MELEVAESDRIASRSDSRTAVRADCSSSSIDSTASLRLRLQFDVMGCGYDELGIRIGSGRVRLG